MNLNLKDKVVLVTGGSKGIGEAIVRTFAAEEATVVIVNRSTTEGVKLADELQADGKKALFIQADLAKDENCRRAIEVTLEKFSKLDVLVNNAGVNDGVGITSSPKQFMDSLQLNLMHYFAMVHYGLDALKLSKGTIINIGSKVADTGQGGTAGYAASKGGCNGLTRELALDLAPFGIRVNAVIPSEAMTPQYARWLDTLDDSKGALERIESLIPLERRMTTKEEIADMSVFLASSRSSHTTGQIIYVDGGYRHLDRACTVS